MKMDAGLDTGPELLRRELAIGRARNRGQPARQTGCARRARHRRGRRTAGPPALDSRTPQPAAGATYAAKIDKDEARIDWSRPAVEIDRQVRAFNPWPVAETRLGEDQVRIWEAQPVAAADEASTSMHPAAAGHRRAATAAGRLLVATGDGLLELLTLQLPGRKPLPARDLLNARGLAGARFGDAS